MGKKLFWSLKRDIINHDWNWVHTYTLPEMRFAQNEGDLTHEQYQDLLKAIMKKFGKEEYEL